MCPNSIQQAFLKYLARLAAVSQNYHQEYVLEIFYQGFSVHLSESVQDVNSKSGLDQWNRIE